MRETPGAKDEEREGVTSTSGKAPSHKKTKNRGKNEEQNVNGHDGNHSGLFGKGNGGGVIGFN